MKLRWAYPANWEELARQCKERANWRCEDCGVPHGAVAISRRTGVVYVVRLAAAHLDHDPWNPSPRLRALCPSCHARYDQSHRERKRWLALERLRHQWLVERWRARQAVKESSL
jgi:hypothetical protein